MNAAARHMVTMDRLCVGLYVRLDSWLGHPFLFSSFRIRDEKQIELLRSLGLAEIEYVPAKSAVQPLPARSEPVAAVEAPAPAGELDTLMNEKRERIETLTRERERIKSAEKKYVKTAAALANLMRQAQHNPAQTAEQARGLATEMADLFLAEEDPFIHLMSDNVADESLHFHCLNVTVLSLIIARAADSGDFATLRDIAQGAMLHDVGKAMIPSQVLLKTDELTQAELKLLQMHPGYGLKLMQPVESLSMGVKEIILFHHERLDGSGYPKGLKGDSIGKLARIVAIANAYDNLCNPRQVARARTPSEALSFMYKNEIAHYDKGFLSAFVKALGIYPPGTIVVLKSGRIGIVMSVDSGDLLHPNLMLYDRAIPKESAAVVNLRRDLDDSVERTLRPGALPPEVHDYLSPRKRICYFVDHGGA